jgi:hypothetical protein
MLGDFYGTALKRFLRFAPAHELHFARQHIKALQYITIQSVLRIWMFIPDPGYQIQQQKQKRRGGENCCPSFFVATNITKLKIILFFDRVKKKF